MKTNIIIIFYFITILLFGNSNEIMEHDSQDNSDLGYYNELYPIGENTNIGYMFSDQDEKTIFVSNLFVRLGFYNDILKKLANNEEHAYSFYLGFYPQIRMYRYDDKNNKEPSVPVKMPSYKVILGF